MQSFKFVQVAKFDDSGQFFTTVVVQGFGNWLGAYWLLFSFVLFSFVLLILWFDIIFGELLNLQ